jgi:GT2 family glycosyltransferase
MNLSVVVVTFNSEHCVGECLSSVEANLPGAEVIVVDNGSQDGTLAAVENATASALVVKGHANLGYGRGCNLGVERAAGSHLLFLNPDVVLTAADLPQLESGLRSAPFGLRSPLVAPARSVSPRPLLRRHRHWLVETADQAFGSMWPRELARRPRYAREGGSGWASGAILLARRDEFTRVGGFDPRFFLYYEDRDLSNRYSRAGLPIEASPALRARHHEGRSSASAELGAVPLAWGALGHIQYLYVWEGSRRARVATKLITRTLRGLAASLRLVGSPLPSSTRVVRKRKQIAEELRALAEISSAADGDLAGFCPDARRLVSEEIGDPR